MNKWFVISLFFLSLNSYSQDFEGIIEYKMSYTLKSDRYSIDFLEKEMGKNVKIFFKNGFYKELTDSKFMYFQLFRYSDNRIYFKNQPKNDTLYYRSTLADHTSNFDYVIQKKADTLLGVVCDKLTITDNFGTKTYYYSSEYSLDPEYYKNFTFINKYEIVKLMKAVYLKLVMDLEFFKVEIKATNIERKKLPDKVFALPENTILVAQ